ncbi:hypothetical protein EJO66_32170 [Variovorax beijingensis]|uniref:HEPN domain-containing protein n=1 Tax=Variovorax beijingensis TaxID=2496117 RepID=A0ABX9ZWP6_9BURK|nr:hypothetical protein [Variovorax beijingensis]RSZ24086.1 hypothetical protein EJO66_32170 [Variovorax beijingensis]
MAKFPDDLYFTGASEPAGVLFWGKSAEQTEKDLAAGIARLGGFRAPNYGQAYLLAANTLLTAAREKKTLDHHGLPIFFLQRHSAELLIKAPLQLGIDVQKYREKLGRPRSRFPSKNQAYRAENWHGLRELLVDLEEMAKALQVGIVPDAVRSVVAEILAVEMKHTWSRYSYDWYTSDGGGDKALQVHMKDEVVIPLAKIQNLLQAANDALGTIWPFHGGLIMGALGGLYEGLLREAREID